MFTSDDWPRRCGFEWDARRRLWTCGEAHLRQIARRYWKLFRGPDDLTGRLVKTSCQTDESIAVALSSQVRDLMGGQVPS